MSRKLALALGVLLIGVASLLPRLHVHAEPPATHSAAAECVFCVAQAGTAHGVSQAADAVVVAPHPPASAVPLGQPLCAQRGETHCAPPRGPPSSV